MKEPMVTGKGVTRRCLSRISLLNHGNRHAYPTVASEAMNL